jgi:hypothetical protein
MRSEETKVLRRTVQPYVGQTLIILAVTAFSFWVAMTKEDWEIMWGPALIWALYSAYVLLFGLKYRISWDEAGVTMHASGGPKRIIRFEEISQVRYETAGVDEFLSQSRPFRRIVLLGSKHRLNEQIDVSLHHFQSEDIKKLLAEIRNRRPDISIPSMFVDK